MSVMEGKKSLKDIMNDIVDEGTNDDVTSMENKPSVSQADAENTDWFKGLSQDQKDKLRNGEIIDPDMKDLNNAIKNNEQELLQEINDIRAKEGQSEITLDEFKKEEFKDSKIDENEDEEILFKKQLLEHEGEEEDSSSPDEETQRNELKQFERSLNESVAIDFDERDKDVDFSSAALNIRVVRNTDYEENLKSVLENNDIKFKVTKKEKLKKALLRNYIQRNPHVTTPLINSGIFVTISGASVPEIIHMNNLNGKKRSEIEMKKMAFIQKHLIDTSIGGKLSLTQLLKVVYYKDIQTMWFNLFIGTFPGMNDFPVTCENQKCNTDLKLQVHASDLVLNPEDFTEASKYILYENMDIKDVLEQSALSKEKQVKMKDHTIIGFRNPSIYDLIYLTTRLEELQSKKDLSQYQNLLEILIFISYIALPDIDGVYIKYEELNDILEILLAMDETMRGDIGTHIEEYTEKNIVKYGLKSYTCPKCNKVHPEKELDMSEFLFTLSRLKWAMMELQKMKLKEQNEKNGKGSQMKE